MPTSIDASAALERLREGNARFVSNVRSVEALQSSLMRSEHAEGQAPYAIVLGCSDSRVPVETLFDQGLGSLFVIRVAGNIVAPSQIGSVELAAELFGSRLVVVLGHARCGAIRATLEAVENPATERSRNQLSILERIRPAVQQVLAEKPELQHGALLRECVRANVIASVGQLRQGSPLLEELIQNRGLRIVGAEYDLVSGVVQFFEGVPL